MKLDPATDLSDTSGSTTTLLSTTTTSLTTTGESSDQDDIKRSCPTLIERDRVREYLEKNPQERTDKDIQFLLDFMQHMPAFSNMTMSMKRSLCRVMVFAVVEKAGTVVLHDREKLDSWSVILNGHVEVTKPDGTIQHLHMGDSFGVSSTKDTMLHDGVMTTKSDDCQFVCIPQEDFYDILHKEKENIIRIQDVSGDVVMVMEKRECEEKGSFVQGKVVLRGTPEMLMRQLMEENTMDETYVIDFLLTYRTFMKSPLLLADFLMSCLHSSNQLDKAFDVMHTWTVNHMVDFESNVDLFARLEKFIDVLRERKLFHHVSTLQQSCSDRAQMRQVLVVLKNDEEPLQFVLVGGQERNSKIFVRQVDDNSPASKAGLRVADQIISVNNHNLEGIRLEKAYEFLKMASHLMLTVRSNLYEFEQLRTKSSTTTSPTIQTTTTSQSSSVPPAAPTPALRQTDDTAMKRQQNFDTNATHFHLKEADSHFSSLDSVSSPHKGNKRADQSPLQTSKLRQALGKMNLIQRSENCDNYQGSRASISSASCVLDSSSVSSWNQSVDLFRGKPALLFSPNCNKMTSEEISAIVVYRADQSCKHILVKKSTTVQEVIEAVLAEFEISDSPSHFSLCQVTVDEDGTMKTKHLPNHINDLADKCTFNSRYYLRDTRHMERLIQGDLASILQADINFLQLPFNEVACQLTQRDMNLFCGIDPVEYVNDLFEIAPIPQLTRFSELVNEEMFWVVTEVCSEPNCLKRSKMLKHFIRIAEKCHKLKNFNSMFAILSGLGHGSVARLRQTWDKLPEKYHKLFEEMQGIMDPSRNMLKYRNLLLNSSPPLIPFFPLVKKDLTFIHFGNDSRMEGLINFDKLRMIAKEIRLIFRIASSSKFPTMENLISSSSNSSLISVSTTPAKKTPSSISVSSVTSLNARKVYEEGQTARMVKTYIANLKIISNENKLSTMSLSCEPNGKTKKSVSSSSSNVVLSQPVCTMAYAGSKFGSESPTSIKKLMSLSQAVKPLPVPLSIPHQHRHLHNNKPIVKTKKLTKHQIGPIPLSQESSSVTNFSPKKNSVFRIFKDSKLTKASSEHPPPISSASSVSSLSSSSTGSSSSSGSKTLLPLPASSLAPSTEQPPTSSSSTVPTPAGNLAATSMQISFSSLKTVNRSSSTSSGIYSMASASSLHHHQDVIHLDDDVEADVDDDGDDISDQSVTGSSCPDDLQLVCRSADRIFDSDVEGTLKHSNSSTLVRKRHSVDGNFFFDASPSPNGPPSNLFSSDNCTDRSQFPSRGSISLLDSKLIPESTCQSLKNILPIEKHSLLLHQQQQQVSLMPHKQQLFSNTQQHSKQLQKTTNIQRSPSPCLQSRGVKSSAKLPSYSDVIALKQLGSSSSSSSSSSSPRLIYHQQEPYQQLKQHLQSQYHQPQLDKPIQAVSSIENSHHLHSQRCCCSVCIKSSYHHLSSCRDYCWQQKMLNNDYDNMPQHLSTNVSGIQHSNSCNQNQHSHQFFNQLLQNNTTCHKGCCSPFILKNGDRFPSHAIPESHFKYLPYQTIQGNEDDELVTLV